jgi:cytoskeletal protein CcmA (bactofilin family)
LFKRRKPDEPASSASTTPLPAGLPLTTEDSKPELSQADSATRTETIVTTLPDTGLGVPPFRPAPPKDAQNMSRPPFSSTPTTPATTTLPATPATPARPSTSLGRTISRDPSERRTLVVGRGISVQGIVQDAERLVVEGTVEATMIHATELAIAPGGVFKGEVEVEDAEIAGTIDGTLTARGSLIVRASGKVLGTARCRRLQVEDGGQITGRIEMISDTEQSQTTSSLPPRQTVEPAI